MPSASNGKSEKAASSEAPETPIRQVITIIEHKIRNLEKRKSKLTSYRDLQKSGKDLNADQKIAVAKYDEVAQTLDFARDLSKQVASIAIVAERDAKKQAKKDAWVRNASDTSKIREVLLILDCLTQLCVPETRDDFLNGTNGAVQLTQDDMRILDNLYPEVTPKHEINEEGVSGFSGHIAKAAEHLYGIIDGKPKEVFGTTYTHIKQIIANVQSCGYFDKGPEVPEPEPEVVPELVPEPEEELVQMVPEQHEPSPVMSPARMFPVPPSAAVVPAPAYPLRPVPTHMTLQEIEHAYFSQFPPQPQRPIAEVIGSHDFYFLQDSELDSPVGTPQPPPSAIPTQTFTNQHFVPMEPQLHLPHFAPHPPPEYMQMPTAPPLQQAPMQVPVPPQMQAPPPPPHNMTPVPVPIESPRRSDPNTPVGDKEEEDWKENGSPEQEDNEDKSKGLAQGDPKKRFRRYGRGPSNGFRGRGNFHNRQNDGYYNRQNNDGYQNRQHNDGYQNRQHNDGYQNRQNNDGYQNRQNNDGYQGRQNNDGYQNRQNDYRQNKDGYQGRQYSNDSYQNRNKDGYQNRSNDSYYGNGDAGHQQENGGTRSRFESSGYRSRGSRGRGPPRGRAHFARKPAATEAAE